MTALGTPSRRSLLATLGVLGGAGVGAALLVEGEPDTGLGTKPGAAAVSGLPARLRGTGISRARPGAEPGRLPPRGTPSLPFGDLDADGQMVGRFDTSAVQGGRETLHLQRLTLPGGMLVGLGPSAEEASFVIVGATGAYAGASGGYVVRRHDDDDTFEFDFTETQEA